MANGSRTAGDSDRAAPEVSAARATRVVRACLREALGDGHADTVLYDAMVRSDVAVIPGEEPALSRFLDDTLAPLLAALEGAERGPAVLRAIRDRLRAQSGPPAARPSSRPPGGGPGLVVAVTHDSRAIAALRTALAGRAVLSVVSHASALVARPRAGTSAVLIDCRAGALAGAGSDEATHGVGVVLWKAQAGDRARAATVLPHAIFGEPLPAGAGIDLAVQAVLRMLA